MRLGERNLGFDQIRFEVFFDALLGVKANAVVIGMLACPNPATYGMFRMLQALNHEMPAKLNIFNSHVEAEQWLCQLPSNPAP